MITEDIWHENGIEKKAYAFKNEKSQYHRVDGPAIFYSDCLCEEYFLNGRRHNLNGPARRLDAKCESEEDMRKAHYVYGIQLNKKYVTALKELYENKK